MSSIKRGRTIVAERERTESESERLKMRQRETMRKRVTAAVFVTAVIVVILLIVSLVRFVWSRHQEQAVPEVPRYTPTVEIIDEQGNGYAEKSDKLKSYVGQLEHDFEEAGYKVAKVVLPASKLRELDVYLEGREEYYKCQLDRGTAETVEDALRMIHYLEGQGIAPLYVDVRLEGRAYYK